MGILEYGAKFCAKKLDEMDRTQRYPIAVPSPEIVLHTDLPYCSGGDPAHRLDLCYPAKGRRFSAGNRYPRGRPDLWDEGAQPRFYASLGRAGLCGGQP